MASIFNLNYFFQIHLSDEDMAALTGTGNGNKGGNKTNLVFLYHVTKDNINVCQTCNLIFSLVRNNQELAEQVLTIL